MSRALTALLEGRAYPHRADTVQLIETHVSWVLLAGEFAYKIKRPVRYDFVDLRELESRKFYCEEEVRLNRRFAPELYLRVSEIVAAEGGVRIGGPGEPIEYGVCMHRFDRADELDQLLEARRIEPSELEDFGRSLALIHARLPAATASAPWGEPDAVATAILRNLDEAAAAGRVFGTGEEIKALRDGLRERLAATAPAMTERRANGRVRECHGDLHARNLVRIGRRMLAFDCIEFEPAFRWIDVADEIAFLLSDLAARGQPLHAHAFRSGYLGQSGDYHACRVLPVYRAHRALVRAKVAALAASGAPQSAYATLRAEHSRLLGSARSTLAERRPRLLLMCGLSGSGKTWVARALAPPLNAIHLRSDVERKRRAGLGAQDRSASQLSAGLYSPQASASVYRHLGRCAEDALAGGCDVIVDASFLRRGERIAFRELARRLNVTLRVIHCRAPYRALQARVVLRQHAQRDASEADLRVLEWQAGQFEPITSEESLEVIPADTTDPNVYAGVLRSLGSASLH